MMLQANTCAKVSLVIGAADFTAADAEQFDRLAGQCLIEWGYEPDDAWVTTVPGQLTLERRT